MDYQLLGPVEAFSAGRSVGLGGRRQQAALAALLLNAGRLVSVERLTEVIWNGDAPETARAQVQTCVSTLRRKVHHPIVSKYVGYTIEVAPEQIDLGVYRSHIDAGRAQLALGHTGQAVVSLRTALDLWRGAALTGVPGLSVEATRLEEERLTVTEEMLDAELALGRHAALVGTLASLVDRHPLRERFRAQLMLALHTSGRKAEALQQYHEASALMVHELGVRPGGQLQALFQRLLTDESDHLPAPVGSSHHSGIAGAAASVRELCHRCAPLPVLVP
jgi:DNA-binding SARP family transcriptional activator